MLHAAASSGDWRRSVSWDEDTRKIGLSDLRLYALRHTGDMIIASSGTNLEDPTG